MNDRGEIEEDLRLAFAPQPDWVFLADIRGNGDKEVFFLRDYPEGKDGARLIMRDDWGDDQRQNTDLIEWSLMVNGSNNEFRAGAGGDIDGDGKDEVILLRNDRIRVFLRPENGSDSLSNFTDYMVPTDNRRTNLQVGDLDRNGSTTGPVLAVSGNMVDATIPAGTISKDYFVDVANIGAPSQFGVNAIVPSSDASWAQINPSFATPPVSFRVRFNATKLSPGQYSTTMTLTANQPNVLNDNYIVHLNLTVVAPVLSADPPILSIYQFPCENKVCSGDVVTPTTDPITTTVRISGSIDLTFRASILGVPKENEGSVSASGLAGPITGGKIDESGNIVVYDSLGNSRTLGDDQVSASAATSNTVLVDPALTWVTSATLDHNVAPADLTLVVNPSILTKRSQREYAVLVLVADTRAGTPSTNVYLVPIQLANIGKLLWIGALGK